MFILYRAPESAFADEVVHVLKDWVLAHRVVTVRDARDRADLPDDLALPVLAEGRHYHAGPDAIRAVLGEVTSEVAFSRSLSGDACYLDPDNPGVCI